MAGGEQPCDLCNDSQTAGRPSGVFNLLCLGCCARLVLSARPLRRAQEAMLASIARMPGAPSRAQVLSHLQAGAHSAQPNGPCSAESTPNR